MTHVHVARARAEQERIQRGWELGRALEAARTLEARLELLGDRRPDVEAVRGIRNSLAGDLERLGR